MRRHWPEQVHILFASAILLVILVLVYQIAARYNRRFDLTREKLHSVSHETQEVLDRMKHGRLTVRTFLAENDPARRDLEIFFKQSSTQHPDFHYSFYDPDRSPSEARKYRVNTYGAVVIEYENQTERIQGFTEEAFTNALIRLAHPKARTLCFTTGHGETSLEDTDRAGLSLFKEGLQDHRYSLKEVHLTRGRVPRNCDVLVMAGPRYELLSEEVDLLARYPKKGKGFFLLIDPMEAGKGKSFSKLLQSFGMKLGENVVVDKVSRVFGGDFLAPLVAEYADHPITKGFHVAMFLPIARTISRSSEVPEGVQVTELARSTAGSWAETDLKRLENGEARLDPVADTPGPLSLVAVAETGKGRVGAIGDSDLITNAHLSVAGNRDFILNLIEWLIQDDRWIAIRPRESRFEPLFLRVQESAGVAGFAAGALPLGTFFIGSLGIWWRRRSAN